MRRILIAFAILGVSTVFSPEKTTGDFTPLCEAGSLLLGDGQCYPVVDRTQQFGSMDVPNPYPGVDGWPAAGVDYKDNGFVDGSEGVYLTQSMIVYPDGLPTLGVTNVPGECEDCANTIFTTETNRTEHFMEVFAIYSDGTEPKLGVFENQVGFVFDPVPMSQVPCYVQMELNDSGAWNYYFSYVNWSWLVSQGTSPDTWLNEALWFNNCTDTLDLVYEHEFQANQRDCSEPPECAQWAGIIETSPGTDSTNTYLLWTPDVELPMLGFKESLLINFKAGEPSGLFSPNWTTWHPPAPQVPWQTEYLAPNYSWTAGTYLDADGDVVQDGSDNCPTWYNPSQGLPDWTMQGSDVDCDSQASHKSAAARPRVFSVPTRGLSVPLPRPGAMKSPMPGQWTSTMISW